MWVWSIAVAAIALRQLIIKVILKQIIKVFIIVIIDDFNLKPDHGNSNVLIFTRFVIFRVN